VIVETPGGRLHRPYRHRRDRPLRLAHGNVEGVRDVVSLAGVSKVVSAGWSEGSLKWRNLPREELQLVQAQGYIDTSTRPAQRGLQRDAGDAVPGRPQGRDGRAGDRGGQGLPSGAHHRGRHLPFGSPPATSA
jgi:hypothetical protein